MPLGSPLPVSGLVLHLMAPVARSMAEPSIERLFLLPVKGRNVVRNSRLAPTAMPPWPSLSRLVCQRMFWWAATLHVVGAPETFARNVPSGPPACGQLWSVAAPAAPDTPAAPDEPPTLKAPPLAPLPAEPVAPLVEAPALEPPAESAPKLPPAGPPALLAALEPPFASGCPALAADACGLRALQLELASGAVAAAK